MGTYTFQYNVSGTEYYPVYDDNGDLTGYEGTPVAYQGPVIGPFSVPNGYGGGPDNIVYSTTVSAGDVAVGTISGGQIIVDAGGETSGVAIVSDGFEYVEGGTAVDTQIDSGSYQYIEFRRLGSEYDNQWGSNYRRRLGDEHDNQRVGRASVYFRWRLGDQHNNQRRRLSGGRIGRFGDGHDNQLRQ